MARDTDVSAAGGSVAGRRPAAVRLWLAADGCARQPPCVAEFGKLRGEVENRSHAAKAASQKKVGREEMCKYITIFFEAETKWVKYTETNVQQCGIPIQIVSRLKQMHSNTGQTKVRICKRGPGQAPSLHGVPGRGWRE